MATIQILYKSLETVVELYRGHDDVFIATATTACNDVGRQSTISSIVPIVCLVMR